MKSATLEIAKNFVVFVYNMLPHSKVEQGGVVAKKWTKFRGIRYLSLSVVESRLFGFSGTGTGMRSVPFSETNLDPYPT
jgi:hypothetical protein